MFFSTFFRQSRGITSVIGYTMPKYRVSGQNWCVGAEKRSKIAKNGCHPTPGRHHFSMNLSLFLTPKIIGMAKKHFFSEVHICRSQLGPKTENRQKTPKNDA